MSVSSSENTFLSHSTLKDNGAGSRIRLGLFCLALKCDSCPLWLPGGIFGLFVLPSFWLLCEDCVFLVFCVCATGLVVLALYVLLGIPISGGEKSARHSTLLILLVLS